MRLEREFEYFLKHQNELAEQYPGKFVAIKDELVLGSFESIAEAVHETAKKHRLGTFLVQKCEFGQEAYTQVFHSRVMVTQP
jgi:hypothetical protein